MQNNVLTAAKEAEKGTPTGGANPTHHLRRAEAYIHANLGEPFSLRNLTEAVETSPSTLIRTFNTHHGVSPMQYVKRLRLEAVRRTLFEADPRSHSVGQAATAFGFRQLGRFSADYKKEFGELPSATLRRHQYRHSSTKGL